MRSGRDWRGPRLAALAVFERSKSGRAAKGAAPGCQGTWRPSSHIDRHRRTLNVKSRDPGRNGSLGRHVVQQAIAARHDVAVVVRTPSKLTAEVRDKVSVHQCDLSSVSIGDLTAVLRGHDAVINTAGLVTEGQAFVNLVDRLVTSLEAVSTSDRPACWFLAGAGYWISMLPAERSRPASHQLHLLAASRELRTHPQFRSRLAAALSRPDGGTASPWPGQTPDVAGPATRSSACFRPSPAGRLVLARVHVPRSGDDHLLRRRRCSDARKLGQGRRNVPPQGWPRAAAGHTGPEGPMGSPTKECGLTFP